MADKINKKTRRLTLCALFTALGTLILCAGTLLDVLDLSSAVLASFLVVLTVIEYRSSYGFAVYAAISLLSMILMPGSAAAVFLLFAGYYPILKEKYEKKPPMISWVLKFVTFNISLAAICAVLHFFFGGIFESRPSVWLLGGIFILCNAVFLIYDIAMTRIISLYIFKIRKRFKK